VIGSNKIEKGHRRSGDSGIGVYAEREREWIGGEDPIW